MSNLNKQDVNMLIAVLLKKQTPLQHSYYTPSKSHWLAAVNGLSYSSTKLVFGVTSWEFWITS